MLFGKKYKNSKKENILAKKRKNTLKEKMTLSLKDEERMKKEEGRRNKV